MILSRNSQERSNFEYYKMLKEAGWQAIDINETGDHTKFLTGKEESLAFVKNVIDMIHRAGLEVGQCHAPMAVTYENDTDGEIARRFSAIENCVEVASDLKIPYTIVHPIIYSWSVDDPNPEKTRKLNIEHLKRAVARAKNTVVCLENLPGRHGVTVSPEDVKNMCDEVSPNLMVCLDTGHAISNGFQPSAFFSVLGDKIKALHVHDSTWGTDMHLLPHSGKVDWNDFRESLIKYNYQGTLNSEASFAVHLGKAHRLRNETFERMIFEELM